MDKSKKKNNKKENACKKKDKKCNRPQDTSVQPPVSAKESEDRSNKQTKATRKEPQLTLQSANLQSVSYLKAAGDSPTKVIDETCCKDINNDLEKSQVSLNTDHETYSPKSDDVLFTSETTFVISELIIMVHQGEQWMREIDEFRLTYSSVHRILLEMYDVNRYQKFFSSSNRNPFQVKSVGQSPYRPLSQPRKKIEKPPKKVENRLCEVELTKIHDIVNKKIKENEKFRLLNLNLQRELKSKDREIRDYKNKLSFHEKNTQQQIASFREKQNSEFKTSIAVKNIEIQRLKKELETLKKNFGREQVKTKRLQQMEHSCIKDSTKCTEVRSLQRKNKSIIEENTRLSKELDIKNCKIESLLELLSSEQDKNNVLKSEMYTLSQCSLNQKPSPKVSEISVEQCATTYANLFKIWGGTYTSRGTLHKNRKIMKNPRIKGNQFLKRFVRMLMNHRTRLERLENIHFTK